MLQFARFLTVKRKAHSDPADLNELIRLYEDEGLSLRAIAARIGVSFQRVHERLAGAGVRFRPVGGPQRETISKRVIMDLHLKQWLSISEIVEQLGTTENHVRTSMEVHKIKPLTISKLSALAKLTIGETLEMPRPGRRRYYSTIYSRAKRAGVRVSIRTIDSKTIEVRRVA